MTLLMRLVPMKNCPEPVWLWDHMEQCHLQRYVEYIPLGTTLCTAVAYTVIRGTRPVIQYIKGSREQNECEFIQRPANRSDKNSWVAIRTKSTNDKLRIVSELLLCTVEMTLYTFIYRNHGIRKLYHTYSPGSVSVAYLLSIWTVFLSAYRILGANSINNLPARPFIQSANIYIVQLLVLAASLYSNSIGGTGTPFLAKCQKFLIATSVLKLLVLLTSPINDGSPRMYYTPRMKPSLEPVSSILRQITCCWNTGLIFETKSKDRLTLNDVWDMEEGLQSYKLKSEYSKTHPNWSITWRLAYCYKKLILLQLVLGCADQLLNLSTTFFVNRILRYAEDQSSTPTSLAWLFVLGMAVRALLSATITTQGDYYGVQLQIAIRSVLGSEIYQKALMAKVSSDASSAKDKDKDEDGVEFNPYSTGSVINLMSVDIFNVSSFASEFHSLISSPLVLVLGTVYLFTVIGRSAIAGLIVMLLAIPINYVVAELLGRLQDKIMAIGDERIGKTNESLNAVRIIKFFAWEDWFIDGIMTLRNKELSMLWYRYIWLGLSDITFFTLPLLITSASFIWYVKVEGKVLTSSVAFTAIAIFNVLRYPLEDISQQISELMSSRVAMKRIQTYLGIDESPKYELLDPQNNPNSKIGFENASFTWGKSGDNSSTFKLRDIDVKFIQGEMNIIIGPTGSGKTSLLMALLGEMSLIAGAVYLPNTLDRSTIECDQDGLTNTVAFCSQQAWMVNDTVRRNILFASPYERTRYEQVLKACELDKDLKIFPDGDHTLIGDKGVSLSGGQKQRVSLARALYSSSRHLILDDCLSAVDSHTANAIYNNALTGTVSKGRTVILVSHNVALTISRAKHVVVLDNGRVVSSGSPGELNKQGRLGMDELISKCAEAENEENPQSTQDEIVAEVQPDSEEDTTERTDEREEAHAVGAIPLSTYLSYIGMMGGALWCATIFFLIVLSPISQYIMNLWLRKWATYHETPLLTGTLVPVGVSAHESASNSGSVARYASMYIITGLVYASSSGLGRMFSFYGSVRASRKVFQALLDSIMHAKVEFFDVTPIGRIINRFSKDMEEIDHYLTHCIDSFVRTVLDSLAVIAVICYSNPAFIPVGIMISIACGFVAVLYLVVARELKRLGSTSRSPIFQQFGETLEGAVSIRAYNDTGRFSTLNMNNMDKNNRCNYQLWLANRWLSYWYGFISAFVTTLSASFVVLSVGRLDSGAAGIILSYTVVFNESIYYVSRHYNNAEMRMNSMERVKEYMGVEVEAPAVIEESKPPSSWPQRGKIEFQNLSLRYKANLPPVIKNVSFTVQGGDNIGIVGRTGAGKSTIVSAIFRILEASGGSVLIDGIDISTVGLKDLRQALAIIPQDPTLFTGTIRSNLDMFNEFSDSEILHALSQVKLVPQGTTTASTAQGVDQADTNRNIFLDLESRVAEGGNNLSQGQRQLLCLARAILRKPRVLVMDEATASIDYDTDASIQEAIRQEFSSVSVLTIAHRLRTIADYDRVLVLDKGEVAEYDTPSALLSQGGIFYEMCLASGELDALIELAG